MQLHNNYFVPKTFYKMYTFGISPSKSALSLYLPDARKQLFKKGKKIRFNLDFIGLNLLSPLYSFMEYMESYLYFSSERIRFGFFAVVN